MALPVPLTERGAQALRTIIDSPARSLFAVDFDGTLAPIVDDPADARPHPQAPAALRELAAALGTVAIVTGRPAPVVAAMLGFDRTPPPSNVVVVGHYGLEQWTPAGVVRLAGVDDRRVAAVRAALPIVLRSAPAGTTVEDKGVSLAVHVRRTAQPLAAMAQLHERLAALAAEHGLRLEPGRLVLELRPAGIDKGQALQRLVDDARAHAAAYVGDDLADLAAFDALDALHRRGVAVLAVFSAAPGLGEVDELARRADLVLDGSPGVVDFIGRLVAAIGA